MTAVVHALGRPLYVRYLGVSAIALAADLACFWLLLTGGTTAAAASAVSYSVGILVHWAISSRAVFIGRLAVRGVARGRQQALFLISALAGLGLTIGIVGFGPLLGLAPLVAKAVAIAVSFQATYLLRRHVVFRG